MNDISIREGTISDATLISNFQQHMALETESKILDEYTVLKGVEKVLASSDRGFYICLLYTSPSPRDGLLSRMPSYA